MRILAQAGARPHGGDLGDRPPLYGVWASRSMQSGIGARVQDESLVLDGTLRFASGAGVIDRALVPVWLADGGHQLVDLTTTGLTVDSSRWRTSAMAASRTYELSVAGIRVEKSDLVGPTNFYLGRPGFFPGGVGVAACWAGGAARVFDLVRRRHGSPSASQQRRLGVIRTDLVAAVSAVRLAAARLDTLDLDLAGGSDPALDLDRVGGSDPVTAVDPQVLATEARACVASAVRRIIAEARLITGPPGVALDDELSHALPDLELYALQQNADGDAMVLGDPTRLP
jgi:alkylation response protein AidB-like acyl-CoA dehydrogenase